MVGVRVRARMVKIREKYAIVQKAVAIPIIPGLSLPSKTIRAAVIRPLVVIKMLPVRSSLDIHPVISSDYSKD